MDNTVRTVKVDENANELARSVADSDGMVTFRRVDQPSVLDEAHVVINGRTLSSAESATLRCAMLSFQTHMAEPFPLGNDDHGVAMAQAYRANTQTIVDAIHANFSPAPRAEVYSRDECVFRYCASPSSCKKLNRCVA